MTQDNQTPPPRRKDRSLAQPPRPDPVPQRSAAAAPPPSEPPVDVELPGAELDAPTQRRVADAIAKAIAAELGRVKISSVPPPESEPPRSSMRVAADVSKAVGKKVGVPGLIGVGASTLVAVIVALFRPEYAVPLLKLLAALIAAYNGVQTPEVAP
jgi:hypothetical protein